MDNHDEHPPPMPSVIITNSAAQPQNQQLQFNYANNIHHDNGGDPTMLPNLNGGDTNAADLMYSTMQPPQYQGYAHQQPPMSLSNSMLGYNNIMLEQQQQQLNHTMGYQPTSPPPPPPMVSYEAAMQHHQLQHLPSQPALSNSVSNNPMNMVIMTHSNQQPSQLISSHNTMQEQHHYQPPLGNSPRIMNMNVANQVMNQYPSPSNNMSYNNHLVVSNPSSENHQHQNSPMISTRRHSANNPMESTGQTYSSMMAGDSENVIGTSIVSSSSFQGGSNQQLQQQQHMPTTAMISRPGPIRHRSKSVSANNGHYHHGGGATLHRGSAATASSSATSADAAIAQCCTQCGMNIQAIKEQMMVHERRKIDLMNEKIEVDQALFNQEKKNFKRRLQAIKLSIKKSQQGMASKERQRQLDWIKIQKDMEQQYQDKLLNQQQKYELKLLETESLASQKGSQHGTTMASLEATVDQLQKELDVATTERQEQMDIVQQLQRTMTTTPMNSQQQQTIEQLQRALDDKQIQMESLEMQLLELERECDASGVLRGSGGSTVAANLSGGSNTNGSTNNMGTITLDRQLSDAKLQIDTLQNRQFVTDQKLSQERRKYDELREKMDALEATVAADRNNNDQRLRMAKDIKDLQQQLNDNKIRDHESAQQRKVLEQKVIKLQQENEVLEEKLTETQSSNESLQNQYKEAKERADVAYAIATATQRAVEDNGTSQQMIEVLSGCVTASTVDSSSTPSTMITSVSEAVASVTIGEPTSSTHDNNRDEQTDNDANRRNVMEYEWHGAQFSGIYTGQLSVISNNPDGDGTLRLDDGAVYNGEWCNGQPHGPGVWATIEGDLFCSQSWNNGSKHGKTVDVLCDGCVYRGNYEYGKRHGHGILTWPYGANYIGQFLDDKRNGEGVYTYSDGRCYNGTYKDDRPHGYGKMTTSDGAILYDGMWQLGEFIGNNSNDKK
jgi:hypothetical protein